MNAVCCHVTVFLKLLMLFAKVFVDEPADCPPYADFVNYRRPSLSGRLTLSLEQSVLACHVCNITVCFLQPSEDVPL